MPKAVIFDIDGTLIDTVRLHAEAWAETFQHYGIDVPVDDIRAQIGKGGDQLMPALLPADVVQSRGKAIEARRTDVFRERYLPNLRPLPGARELVRRVAKAGALVALASSAKPEELDALKRIVGLSDEMTDAETSAGDAERSKPFPDIFEAALARMTGVSAADAIVIGDSPYDAEAARRIGMPTIGLLSGGFTKDELLRAGAIAIYRDPAHLLEDYDNSPLGTSGLPD